MVFEQVLTILVGTGAGVAAVLYTVKPRQIAQSFVETISLPSQSISDSQNYATATPAVTATRSRAAEAPVETHPISSGIVSTIAVASQASSGTTAIASIDASVVSAPAAMSVMVGAHASTALRGPRTPRRSSAGPSRTPAKPGASGSLRAARKRLD